MAKKTHKTPAATLITEAKELCGECPSLVCVDDEWWCEEFDCSIVRIVSCLKWKGAADKESKRMKSKRGKPGKAPRDRTRCVCGRNLLYPRSVSESWVVCRCGRRHLKKAVLKGAK